MSDLKYWLGFSKIYSIGSVLLTRLLNHFESIDQCWHATTADLLEIERFSPKIIEKFHEEKKTLGDLDKLEEEILRKNIQVITFDSNDYPYYLKQIYDPPIALFLKGSLKECDPEKCLAVVGSRKSSSYIKEVLKKIIADLRGTDITIVSGMALGVDSCAHSAAIANNLTTFAVIGSGFDNIYPKQNKGLFEEIIQNNGAVISEYFPDAQPAPFRFPRRNRIISGLSQGTLVAEAGLNSGALITASLCLEQNRELMCIPGQVTNPNTDGIYKLIKEGAVVITNAKDILNHFGWQKNNLNESLNKNVKIKFLDNERKIYEILNLESKTFDDLINESKLSAQDLMTALTSMELNGIITQMPGQMFVKNINY
ncbi:MAG TPA: DNA-processing protein DprA [Candidatus Gastranaerophilales bacterium]|nr:DNA-processing protein DprA [Candidatus Gastranaerophilales bacterium]